MASTWPLTGRDAEVEFIDRVTRRRGAAAGVVLAGSAGVGKTRLARESLQRLAARGFSYKWTVGTASASGIPFGAFAEYVAPAGESQERVLAVAREQILADASRPLAIGVDDAHQLDDYSASLVHQLCRERATVCVITVRSGESAPDAITALWKDELLARLDLQPLSVHETAELLTAALDGQVDSVTARRLFEATQGNALYLHHLVTGEQAEGRLVERDRVWQWDGRPSLSASLLQILGEQLGTLEGGVRDLIDVLALAEPLPDQVVGSFADDDSLEQAEQRSLVVWSQSATGHPEARLGHPLYGEVRRADMGMVRARRLRRVIAAALGEAAPTPDVVLRSALLAMESDNPDPALLMAAAQVALRRMDLGYALRVARAAVAAGVGFDAQAIVAFACVLLHATSPETLEELVILGRLAETPEQIARAAVHTASLHAWALEDADTARRVIDDAQVRLVSEPRRLTLRLLGVRAMLDSQSGRPTDALEALHILKDEAADPPATLTAACAVVLALGVLGRADELEGPLRQGTVSAPEAGELAPMGATLVNVYGESLRYAGYLSAALEHAHGSYGAHQDTDEPALALRYNVGAAELACGNLRVAIDLLREARAAIGRFGKMGGWLYPTLIHLTQALAATGDLESARETWDQVEAHRHHLIKVKDADRLLARAAVSASEGAITDAIRFAREAADVAAEYRQSAQEVLALQAAAAYGDRKVATRLALLAQSVDGPRAAVAADFASALHDEDADLLDRVSSAFEEIGDKVAALDAVAHAAIAYRAAGRHGSAHAAVARARRLSDACGGARTPAYRHADSPLPLTPREREIATLAATGLSNKKIAARLMVSVRTVEGHLYRVFQRLGVKSRDELSTVL